LKFVGVDSHFGLNLVLMLTAWGALAGCYFALREMVSPSFAKGIVCLVAVCHVMHQTSVCILSDIPFMAIVWLGLWCQLHGLRTGRRTLELGSLLLLASCLVRVVGAPIAVGAALGLLLQPSIVSRRRTGLNAGATFLAMLIIAGTALGYVSLSSKEHVLPSYLSEFSRYFSRILPQGVAQPLVNWIQTGPELSILLTGQKNPVAGLWIALLWLPVVTGMVVSWKRGRYYGVCVLASYLLALLVLRPMIARYLLPLAPLLFWYFIEGTRWIFDRRLSWQPTGKRVVLATSLLLLALNLPKTGKLAYRLHYPKTDNAFKEQHEIADVARFLRDHAKPGERFITNEDERQLAYLSGLWTVPLAEHELDYRTVNRKLIRALITPDVSFVVLRNCGKRKHYRQLCRAFSSVAGSKSFSVNEQFLVFHISAEFRTSTSITFSPSKRRKTTRPEGSTDMMIPSAVDSIAVDSRHTGNLALEPIIRNSYDPPRTCSTEPLRPLH